MRGFGAFESAARFCEAYDEVRDFFRPVRKLNTKTTLAEKRESFRERLSMLTANLVTL